MAIKIFSVSSVSTALMVFYLYVSIKSVYNLMYPLHNISDLDSYPPNQLVGNYWKLKNEAMSVKNRDDGKKAKMGFKVYLSTSEKLTTDFVIDEFREKKKILRNTVDGVEVDNLVDANLPSKKYPKHDTILLWEEPFLDTPFRTKSFLLKTITSSPQKNTNNNNNVNVEASTSIQFAEKWLNDLDRKDEAMEGTTGIFAALSSSSAGDGIESTSVLLSLYKCIRNMVSNTLSRIRHGTRQKRLDDEATEKRNMMVQKDHLKRHRQTIRIPPSSSIWKNLMNNSTVYVRVMITRNGREDSDYQTTLNNLLADERRHDLLVGGVNLVKYDLPHHIHKAKRFLYRDILYIVNRYVLLRKIDNNEPAPWNMAATKPNEYKLYQTAVDMKQKGVGYPYWKPEVAIKLVSEEEKYPLNYVGHSQMDVIQVESHLAGRKPFESGYAYLPGLYVDEMGLTSEKYIPLNRTVDALPLRISVDTGESVDESGSRSGLSPGRWRLLRHLASTLESQKDLGFDQSDIDDVKRLIADTNVTLLGITVLASALHLLFEFLTFKNDVEFWRGNKDLTGLSVRALFMDFFSQTIILLYLIEKQSSLLMTIPAACGCLIALWKAQRGSGLKFVKASKDRNANLLNTVLRVFGVELQATRLRAASSMAGKKANKKEGARDLTALSEETDQLATRLLGKYVMLPLVLGYTVHTLINEEHSGWYSWFITSASSAMYGLGFVFMTPQLFLNYKLKSVAHLPWKVLGYRFVNTFIDDLFAFIIRMPTMARMSCFRDDIIFLIYLWQRYLYPVDTSRPTEGGGMDALSAAAAAEIDTDNQDKQKKDQ